ncbi:hypothetical protein V8E53_000957 [Lactarius tabidus]
MAPTRSTNEVITAMFVPIPAIRLASCSQPHTDVHGSSPPVPAVLEKMYRQPIKLAARRKAYRVLDNEADMAHLQQQAVTCLLARVPRLSKLEPRIVIVTNMGTGTISGDTRNPNEGRAPERSARESMQRAGYVVHCNELEEAEHGPPVIETRQPLSIISMGASVQDVRNGTTVPTCKLPLPAFHYEPLLSLRILRTYRQVITGMSLRYRLNKSKWVSSDNLFAAGPGPSNVLG